MTQLIWLRNDLRVRDHQPLNQAVTAAKQAGSRCLAIYLHSDQQQLAHGAGPRKLAAIANALTELKQHLAGLDIELLERSVEDWSGCAPLLQQICAQHQVVAIHCHFEPGFNEYQRDRDVANTLASDTAFHRYNDLFLIHPKKVVTQQGEPFKVYSAYRRAILRQLTPDDIIPYGSVTTAPWKTRTRLDERWENPLQLPVTETEAQQRLAEFLNQEAGYAEARNYPADDGTSRLSVALSLGTISARLIAHALSQANIDLRQSKYFDELLWREFYKYILYHRPELAKGRPFNARWDAFPWQQRADWVTAWQEGRTGVPIVDAAMRQLVRSGWMHNRLRMISGMYLVKILQQDWRIGEAFFASQLADFDFAANNGGWQWVASTGVDAVPYFRIFNPYQQSRKFDPQGRFMRSYLPELASLATPSLHQPELEVTQRFRYPAPVVDYAAMRNDTLARFKQL